MGRIHQAGPKIGRDALTGSIPPGDISIAAVLTSYPRDAARLVTVEVVILWPQPLGSTEGCHLYLDAPDSFGQGTNELGAWELGYSEVRSTFQPEYIGYYSYEPNMSAWFQHAPPAKQQRWRVYAVSGNIKNNKPPKKKGDPNESPNHQFLVDPFPELGSGVEVSPLVQGYSATVEYDVKESGDQYWRVVTNWSYDANHPMAAGQGGVDVMLERADTGSLELLGSVSVPDTQFTSQWMPVAAVKRDYYVIFNSFADTSRKNGYIKGVTPRVLVTVSRQQGPPGQEYALYVTPGVTLFDVTKFSAADGTAMLRIIANATAPADPAYGGAAIVVLKPDGKYYELARARLLPIEAYQPTPAAVENWTFYLVSMDTNNRRNSIVAGTPQQTISLGSTSGQLDLGKVSGNSLGPELTLTGNALTIALKGIGSTKIADHAIATPQLTTAQLDIGGGGEKPVRLRIYDNLASPIAWIGDDTANSGFVGAWFKKLYLFGTSPAAAKIVGDSNSIQINDVSIRNTQNGIVTELGNFFDPTSSGYVGLRVYENVLNQEHPITILPGVIRMDDSLTQNTRFRLERVPGTGTVNIRMLGPDGFGTMTEVIRLSTSNNGELRVNGKYMISGGRVAGWSTPTSTDVLRSAFNPTTISLADLARTVLALLRDLHAGIGGNLALLES